jgi:cation diffusion facilitator CzcD-associated flavoprotein CzcO
MSQPNAAQSPKNYSCKLAGREREREREMRVAVVGAGLSGLAAAHELARSGGARVTVYEKESHLGGRGNKAVAVDDDGAGGRVLVDLGCMAFNTVRACIRTTTIPLHFEKCKQLALLPMQPRRTSPMGTLFTYAQHIFLPFDIAIKPLRNKTKVHQVVIRSSCTISI